MTERERLIEKLVTTLHLSVPERLSLSPEPLRRDEIVKVIMAALGRCGFFPPAARPWSRGDHVFEGRFLELLANGKVRLWAQRPSATDPYLPAQQGHQEFATLHDAIDSFIRREWQDHLIDGIRFVD